MRIGALLFAVSLVLAGLTSIEEVRGTGFPTSCVVSSVIDGDTFVCTDSNIVSLLAVNAPELSQCGGGWAKAALEHIFLRPGTTVRLEYDAFRGDRLGGTLAAPIVTIPDGTEYNISIVMAFVGLARASTESGPNLLFRDWAMAAETWAQVAQWNMWANGGPFNSAERCG
jgi:endonuclease YncB( thermonuclease family)